jgi:hypothetical protein
MICKVAEYTPSDFAWEHVVKMQGYYFTGDGARRVKDANYLQYSHT